MGKNKNNLSRITGRMRGWIQAGATLLSNIHLSNFFKGGIYQGGGKAVCVPGLNCYSCPAASGACPIGAFQAVAGSSKFGFSYYITGFLILVGVLLGRFVCGFLCPFGWLQDLLHKIPGRKISTGRLKPLTYMKYAVLIGTVILLPALMINDVGMGDPYFCKYICPQGVLEGALPLAAANAFPAEGAPRCAKWTWTSPGRRITGSAFGAENASPYALSMPWPMGAASEVTEKK